MSPILYFLKTNSGILSAFDAKTGTPHYQNQRIDSVPTSSPRRSLLEAVSTFPDVRAPRS